MPKNKKHIKIVQKDEGVLREIAKSVPISDITSTHIKKVILDMKTALNLEDDGVAIAAPQIGIPLRIFLISKKAEIYSRKEENLSETEIKNLKTPVYINPEIIKLSRSKVKVDEGCLSVRYLYGKVNRAEKATITAYDENGKKFIQGGSGLLAQIFQHEIDHLNGVLFIDKAENLEEILPDRDPSK